MGNNMYIDSKLIPPGSDFQGASQYNTVQSQQNSQSLIYRKFYLGTPQLQQMVAQCLQKQKMSSENTLKLEYYIQQSHSSYCTDLKTLGIYWKCRENKKFTILKNYLQKEQFVCQNDLGFFSEKNVSVLLQKVLKGLNQYNKIKAQFYEFNISSVLIQAESLSVIVVDPWLCTLNEDLSVYDSPQKKLFQKKKVQDFCYFKSSLYSAGIIALAMLFGNRRLSKNNIKNLTNQIVCPVLRQKLFILTQSNPQRRIVRNFQAQINNELSFNKILVKKTSVQNEQQRMTTKGTWSPKTSGITFDSLKVKNHHSQSLYSIRGRYYNYQPSSACHTQKKIFIKQQQYYQKKQKGHLSYVPIIRQEISIASPQFLQTGQNYQVKKKPKLSYLRQKLINSKDASFKTKRKFVQFSNKKQDMNVLSIYPSQQSISSKENQKLRNLLSSPPDSNTVSSRGSPQTSKRKIITNKTLAQQLLSKQFLVGSSLDSLKGSKKGKNCTQKPNISIKMIDSENSTPQNYEISEVELGYEPGKFKKQRKTYAASQKSIHKVQSSNIIQYQNGFIYEGQYVNNLPHGSGILFYPNGKAAYQGEWQFGLCHGNGTQFPLQTLKEQESCETNLPDKQGNWVQFQGKFQGGKRQGYGVLILANGDTFVGTWKDDTVLGYGIYYKSDGKIVKGVWKDNKLCIQL